MGTSEAQDGTDIIFLHPGHAMGGAHVSVMVVPDRVVGSAGMHSGLGFSSESEVALYTGLGVLMFVSSGEFFARGLTRG